MKYPCLFFVVSSFLIAAVGFWIGPARYVLFAGPNDVPSPELISYCTWTAWLWVAFAVTAVLVYQWRAAVVLLGAPFVLFWPFMWTTHFPQCSILGCW
jgi:hypothetical protein